MRESDELEVILRATGLLVLGLCLSSFETVICGLMGDAHGEAILDQISPSFVSWAHCLGIVTASRGGFLVARVAVRYRNVAAKNRMALLGEMVGALAIPLLLWLRGHVEQLPILSLRDGVGLVSFPQGSDMIAYLRLVVTVGIVALILSILRSALKIVFSEPRTWEIFIGRLRISLSAPRIVLRWSVKA